LSEHKKELDRHFAWFENKLPPRPAKFVGWVRKPSSIYARIPLATLLIAGGVFSFLPILGVWMLPLGCAAVAEADGERTRMDRAQMARTRTAEAGARARQKRAMSRQGLQPIPVLVAEGCGCDSKTSLVGN
jgi:hypothetical protein